MIMRKLAGVLVAILVAGGISTQAAEKEDLEAARKEYQASAHDESARVRYVTKLAQIRERQLHQYWQEGNTSPENEKTVREVNSELQRHPAPPNSDSKKLSKLLVGSWKSPRRVYIFRANGKWGTEDGPVSGSWRISGNQLMEDGSRRTIILIDQNYFIYSENEALFFHVRAKD
jgi:hypothetical protein